MRFRSKRLEGTDKSVLDVLSVVNHSHHAAHIYKLHRAMVLEGIFLFMWRAGPRSSLCHLLARGSHHEVAVLKKDRATL